MLTRRLGNPSPPRTLLRPLPCAGVTSAAGAAAAGVAAGTVAGTAAGAALRLLPFALRSRVVEHGWHVKGGT